MDEEQLQSVLEAALRAQIASRCHRAYRHELRNGLQGIYGGVDALIRSAQAQKPTAIPVDKAIQFTRQAIAGHEQSLEHVIDWLAPVQDEPADVDVSAMLSALTRFLGNDAARNGVRFRSTLTEPAKARTQPGRLHLTLLSLLTDSIDALPQGGEIVLSTRMAAPPSSLAEIEITDSRAVDNSPVDPWTLDLARTPLHSGIAMQVIRRMITAQGGSIECVTPAAGGRLIKIVL